MRIFAVSIAALMSLLLAGCADNKVSPSTSLACGSGAATATTYQQVDDMTWTYTNPSP